MTSPQRYRRRPVDDIQTDAERAAREFLGWEPGKRKDGEGWIPHWVHLGAATDLPGPTWAFFGALWDDCKRRRWVRWFDTDKDGDNGRVFIRTGPGTTNDYESHGDPRHALIRCVCQWLDEQGGNDD